MYPTITPQITPTPSPMAISMGPRMAFVSQLPAKNKIVYARVVAHGKYK